MNYRHIYHAGNFADLMKHLILIELLQKLREKDKAFTVLDAFAGLGIYDLSSEEAQKTKEYENGIGILSASLRGTTSTSAVGRGNLIVEEKSHTANTRLPRDASITRNDAHRAISTYLSIIDSLGLPDLYPGSPYIISQLLREDDNLIASELHPQDYAELKHNMLIEKNTAIHLIDGYNAIKAFLPPKNLRGLVLLDAAFEVKNEYLKIIDALKLIRKRFAAGIVMIWYPIKDEALVRDFYSSLRDTGYTEFLKIEFEINNPKLQATIPFSVLDYPLEEQELEERKPILNMCAPQKPKFDDMGIKTGNGMNKCGVIIANPPYIKDEIESLMHFLSHEVYNSKAKATIELL